MTCHILHAGDGYTYLTRQVASGDIARAAQDPLVAYYQAAGNPPGVWVGAGCADLGVSGQVSEEHMLALFGEGLRPDANEFIADRVAEGQSYEKALKAARLGRKFYQYDNDVPLLADIRAAYTTFEQTQGRRATVDERRGIKEDVARSRLIATHPDGWTPSRERVRQYLTDELGKARQPVSGFDLVFSGVKSAKVLWALGGHAIRRIVEQVHENAWMGALIYGEREAGYTRVGAAGIAFKKVSGWVATAFQHRDSRAGDPDLHTHVVVSNRVLADDGTWRTIDSRQLHRIAVSMSETYNTLFERGLIEQLGVRFVDVPQGAGKRPVREIDGIPVEWLRGFSQRRTQVESGYDALVADYVRTHGHTPPRSVQYQLAQQATLQNRPTKTELHTLAEQVADWTQRAHDLLPDTDIAATIQDCLQRADAVVGVDLADIAAAVVERISEERSTWAVYHLRAEAQRQLRPFAAAFAGDAALLRAVDTVTQTALDRHSILLDVEIDDLPRLLRHPADEADNPEGERAERAGRGLGESVFRRRGSRVYTSQQILDAEGRLVDDARASRGAAVPAVVRDAAILRWQQDNDNTQLNPGQRSLIAHFVSSGRALAVGIGPPGTGKSTTMAAMRAAWETTGGRVIGFAPSAAAASVLGDDLGVRADTLHSLIVARRNGAEVDVRAGDLLLVDETGMAGTRTLDEVRALATERGAVVRLLGDYRQLTAVEAGGALRLIHHDVGGVELTEVHRFARPDEAQAVLQFRVGDDRALDFYTDNDRLFGGVGPAVFDRLYRDWKTDVDAGQISIMISDSTHVARELSARAQNERRTAGLVENNGVRLHDGTIAGVGDRVVTRLNRRRLTLFGGKDFVKNGDLWEVAERFDDGRLKVRHVRHSGTVMLSASYVARFVELGYAATIHRSQGLTVEICRAFLSAMATREAALVALSRGMHGNWAYLDTEQILSADEPPVLPGDLFYRYREARLAEQALLAILHREGAELSATEQIRDALEEPQRLSTVVPQYSYARHLHRGPAGTQEAEQWVRSALPRDADDVLDDEAWPELARVLHEIRDAGVHPAGLLRARAARRALRNDPRDPARSVAQVLHWRIVEELPMAGTESHPDRPDLLPGWVPTPPQPDADTTIPGDLADIIELGAWLRNRAEQIAARVRELGERAAETPPDWAAELGPVPDDPVVREQWIRRAGQVAAYRDRWQITDTDTELLPDGRGEQARARSWVESYLLDHPLDHAAADAARRDTQQRDHWHTNATRTAEHQRRQRHQDLDQERLREEMAALLRESWRHEPDLVELIIAATAFDTVARRLREADEAGYDLRAVLAEIPLDSLNARHIHDPAAYTATLIDIAVDRIRSGEADRDADRRAQQQRFEQMRDQAVDLLRESWAARPHLAEAVIHAPAFNTLVRALDRYTDAGLDARDLLSAIPLAKLDSSTITDPDKFSIYLTHRVAQRQLDALSQARRAAHDHADRLTRHRGAAAVLRHAWHHHPTLAEHVINGPAFRYLADRMHTAQQDGHDVHTVLGELDPVALTAPHVPSPSGATTFAFTRALQQHDTGQPDTEQHDHTQPVPEPVAIAQASGGAREPDHTHTAPALDERPVDQDTDQIADRGPTPQETSPGRVLAEANAAFEYPSRPRVADNEGAAASAHWQLRPHGALTDPVLHARVEQEQRDVDRLDREHDVALRQAEQHRLSAENGQGRHVRAADETLARLRDQAEAVREADQLEAQWHIATERAGHAAEQRAHAEHELEHLGRLARTRRAELAERIDHLRGIEAAADRDATELAQRAAAIHQQTGSREQRQHLQARAHHAETAHPQTRAAALDRDREAADHAERRAAQLLERRQQHTTTLEQLHAEQHLREQLPEPQRQLEATERVIAQPAPTDTDVQPAGPTAPEADRINRELASPDLAETEVTAPASEQTALAEPDLQQLPPPPTPDDPEI